MLFDSIMDRQDGTDRTGRDRKTKVLVMLAKVGYGKTKKKIVSFTPFASGSRCGNGNATPLSCVPVLSHSLSFCLPLSLLFLSRSKTLPLNCCFVAFSRLNDA